MEKHVKRKSYFSKSLREEEKKKRKAPHNLAYVVSANIALAKKHYIYCIVDIVLTSIKCVCEKLELQQVLLFPFPHLENIIFL